MLPKVLIVGTVPYNKKTTARAFHTYFSNWEKDRLAQIFSNTKRPVKGHCATLYQITDQRMLKRRLDRAVKTGKVFTYGELDDEWKDDDLETNSKVISKLYRLGSKKFPLNYLARKWLWKEAFWNTPELNRWLDDFGPECVFLSFSDDFFIPEIALYVAQKYNIPIISSIGDDYYFNTHFSLSAFYYIYKSSYRKLIRRVFQHPGSAIYIGDKIRDKYNREFGLDGKTVFLTSEIQRRPFAPIDRDAPKIVYCGNIRLGRNDSLLEIARVLHEINPQYKLTVFSNEKEEKYYRKLKVCPNVDYRGSVSYAQVKKEISDSHITVVVEGFAKKDVDITRYSLSTKVADSLASGSFVLAYGAEECGAISYMKSIDCGLTCLSKQELEQKLPNLFDDVAYQRQAYDRAIMVTENNHRLEKSGAVFEALAKDVVLRSKYACTEIDVGYPQL